MSNIQDEALYWNGIPVVPEGWITGRSFWETWLESKNLTTLTDWLNWAKQEVGHHSSVKIEFISCLDPEAKPIKINIHELEYRLPKVRKVTYGN